MCLLNLFILCGGILLCTYHHSASIALVASFHVCCIALHFISGVPPKNDVLTDTGITYVAWLEGSDQLDVAPHNTCMAPSASDVGLHLYSVHILCACVMYGSYMH